jgi:hypothetical protein
MTLSVSHLRQCQRRAATALRLPFRGHGSAEFARLVASPAQLASVVARIAALAPRSGERVRATQMFARRTALGDWLRRLDELRRAGVSGRTDEQPAPP